MVRGWTFQKDQFQQDDPNLTVNSRNPAMEERTFHTHLAIEVIDTGIGMDEKSKQGLFTKFGTSMGDNGLNTNGLGLGLYLSKEICYKLGGDIVCHSMKGKGSSFTVKLPLDAKNNLNRLFEAEGENTCLPKLKPSISFGDLNEEFDESVDKKALDNNKYDFQTSANCLELICKDDFRNATSTHAWRRKTRFICDINRD